MKMLTFDAFKPVQDPAVDTAFLCWCFTNGVDPHAVYSAKIWSALFEGFMNDWLDPRLNEKHVSNSVLDARIDPESTLTLPTLETLSVKV